MDSFAKDNPWTIARRFAAAPPVVSLELGHCGSFTAAL
jgi:hypothetical protein